MVYSNWLANDQLGGREERTCNIPAGKAILIPVLTGECRYDVPEMKNDEDLCRCAMAGNNYGVIEATVDGVKLKDLETYRTQSGYFNSIQVKDNIPSRVGNSEPLPSRIPIISLFNESESKCANLKSITIMLPLCRLS